MRKQTKIWIAAGIGALIAASWLVPVYSDICEKSANTGQKDCTAYHILTVILWHIGEFLNYYGVAITAISTAFIGLFTYTLYKTTAVQAELTRDSINLARQEFTATHRPQIRIKHLWIENQILDDGELVLTLLFTNIGDVQARLNSLGLTTVVVPGDGDLPPGVDPQGVQPPIQTPLGLGQTIRINGVRSGRILSHAECVDLRAGGATRLYCIGHVEYLDTNDPPRIRRTNFCRVLVFAQNRRPDNDAFRFHRVEDAEYEYED